ncbi:YbaB/EbfC family nucleoid-associated protein [Actinoplanes sp. LDG1-06]|uniref:YbaB/EbfC family nucleoid-associated protein n=1 Tax=Paractinoplanes ovalisporus TaxID=2810368 RepID=A0ABS2ALZ3_9ACTN|nr:YbaB/EbfC family nucleoid-associated protein [Actinoplanes ovalisporus]MBM2620878.1 YbaB/EbfC family nucleoid-associated protein [Actinoplanes ovalisporus]
MTGFPDAEAFLDPDASREYLRGWHQRVETQAARAQATSERIANLRAGAKDGNGLAEVTVESTGVLVDLKLTDRIHRVEPDVVARAVMEALRKARVQVAERSKQIAIEEMGPGSLTARTIGARAQQLVDQLDAAGDGVLRRGE